MPVFERGRPGDDRQRRGRFIVRSSRRAPWRPTPWRRRRSSRRACGGQLRRHYDRRGLGQDITNSAILALGLSILAILLYVSLRFDYKMSVTAIPRSSTSHHHARRLTRCSGERSRRTRSRAPDDPRFSLYDTIVVFHRIKENRSPREAVVHEHGNESINEVLVRSINTTLTALIPLLVMLFFGGSTLKDFAFA